MEWWGRKGKDDFCISQIVLIRRKSRSLTGKWIVPILHHSITPREMVSAGGESYRISCVFSPSVSTPGFSILIKNMSNEGMINTVNTVERANPPSTTLPKPL